MSADTECPVKKDFHHLPIPRRLTMALQITKLSSPRVRVRGRLLPPRRNDARGALGVFTWRKVPAELRSWQSIFVRHTRSKAVALRRI